MARGTSKLQLFAAAHCGLDKYWVRRTRAFPKGDMPDSITPRTNSSQAYVCGNIAFCVQLHALSCSRCVAGAALSITAGFSERLESRVLVKLCYPLPMVALWLIKPVGEFAGCALSDPWSLPRVGDLSWIQRKQDYQLFKIFRTYRDRQGHINGTMNGIFLG